MHYPSHPKCTCGGIGFHKGSCAIWDLPIKERYAITDEDKKRAGYPQMPK